MTLYKVEASKADPRTWYGARCVEIYENLDRFEAPAKAKELANKGYWASVYRMDDGECCWEFMPVDFHQKNARRACTTGE